MIEEDLVAERIAIESYSEMIRFVGDDDPTTRTMLEGILAMEEEHADDLAGYLARTIHERVRREPQLGSCRCFGAVGPAGDPYGSSRTPAAPKCRQGPRDRRSRSVGALGVQAHE